MNRGLPVGFGYVIKKEPKSLRKTFAMRESLYKALSAIAKEQGTNLNALVNDVLTDFAFNYYKEADDVES